MKISLSTTLALACAATLWGCSSTPKVETAPVAAAPAPAKAAPAPATPAPAAAKAALPAWLDPANPVSSKRSVYFGFDDSSIAAKDRPVVELQGRFLAAHPEVSVRVEGNTDERGSSEYNLALGQRRAEALEKALKVYGARDSQMEAVSWGKEKPKAQGHDEAAWAENRRADVAYPAR
ncbi:MULTISPECIES: peptidoglycan-associated lipoprotein Pal [Ramlibacter]|uniref:Peptidoglycan-associated protein n=1 Tax=Ramlibacter aquaticus TaxID=2780094 RepID=A0ABR9SJF7_9BURK|nr:MULTISPECIES: peptidoglycan-associated lipoprotein Pal [Ramlibacter]MBE7942475.1 peptidoglycan-associated lipoprotein Pal [Ramlibacter aquaticus]